MKRIMYAIGGNYNVPSGVRLDKLLSIGKTEVDGSVRREMRGLEIAAFDVIAVEFRAVINCRKLGYSDRSAAIEGPTGAA